MNLEVFNHLEVFCLFKAKHHVPPLQVNYRGT